MKSFAVCPIRCTFAMRKENAKERSHDERGGLPRDDRETTERVASGNGVVTELIAKQKD